MAVAGLFDLFRGKPRSTVGDGGQMSLADHFRELRARLLKAALAVVVATAVSFFFYEQLIELVTGPYNQAREMLGSGTASEIYVSGVGGGLLIQLKLCALSGVVLSSPVWLYQIWAFVLPGLHANERRWTMIFVIIAGPLFAAGVAVGYYVLPKGLKVLISFTPAGMTNLNDFDDFFSFITRMLLVFGVAFEIPFFVVLLNLAGVISGRTLVNYRPWIVLGTFVFAAVATPSTDPFSMLMLALPMLALFLVSEVIARLVDRRRARRTTSTAKWGDDEPSPL
ncbi:MAG TPA: twin-arginine translocase subunit TatC [Marmoricola sp.]|jgi:sec-independent protein translocase protein TatC|nr:twin-arginine translocase subunit TatC [Marmoricola sp.]